jgi:nucleotide-binding universal stress UspA family protein
MAELQRTIKKILLAVDGSDGSYKAAKMAALIAKGVIAEILAVKVIQESSYPIGHEFMTPILPQEAFAKAEEEANSFLQRIVQLGQESRVDVKTKIIRGGSVVDAICRTAGGENCDLIVIGTRGMTGVKRFLIGSVASGVITYAPCPVLVVR